MKKMIYLDNAATTRTAPEVVEAMLPYFAENYGNPSSVYELAGASKEAVAKARETIAEILGAKFILPEAAQKRTTGRLWRPLRHIREKETISLRQKSNTMRFYTPVNI